ncbi:MAG: hypothetical protein ACI4CT_08945, partial [Lachnospiraceae bacterium]
MRKLRRAIAIAVATAMVCTSVPMASAQEQEGVVMNTGVVTTGSASGETVTFDEYIGVDADT